MPVELTCRCTLCSVETHLLSELALVDRNAVREVFSAYPALVRHPSITNLISHLRHLPADARSDEFLRDLFALHLSQAVLVERLLILTFLPVLHRTVRLVTKQQFELSPEDIAQEALSFFLEFLHSDELRNRPSHFAFVISREIKRHVFTWARRESRKAAVLDDLNGEALSALDVHSSFERVTQLSHFLHRSVNKGMLTDAELDMLVAFKLNGGTGGEPRGFHGTSPNAVRQRLKRLLAKLRRSAR